MSRSYKKHFTVSDNRTSNAKHRANKDFNENKLRRKRREKGLKNAIGHIVHWDMSCEPEYIYQEILESKDKLGRYENGLWLCYVEWLNGRKHTEALLRKYSKIEAHRRSAK